MNSYLRAPGDARLSRRRLLAGAGLTAAALGGLAACGDGGGSGGAGAASAPVSAATADIPVGGGKIFADAQTVITQPSAGQFKAFSSICTHAKCPVAEITDTINCNCHGSKFALADGSVVAGPAPSPLPAKAVTVDGDQVSVTA